MMNRNLLLRCFTPCLCILGAANILPAQVYAPEAAPALASNGPLGGSVVRQVEFKEVPLADAVRLLSRQIGLNLVVSQEAARMKVSLFLQDVSPKAVVEELCRANNLWYRQDETSGIVRIMTVQEFQRDLTAFREEQTRVFAVLYPNAISTATAIQDLYGDRVQLSLGTDEEPDTSRDIRERLDRFDLMDQRSQGLGIYSASGTSVAGGSQYGTSSQGMGGQYTSSISARRSQTTPSTNATADINDTLRQLTPGQAETIARALKDQSNPQDQQAILDAFRRKQANIYVRVIRRNNLIVVRTGDQTALQEIAKLVQRLDVPTPTVLLEVKVLSINLSDDFNSVFDYQFSNSNDISGQYGGGNIQPPPSDLVSGSLKKFASMSPGGTNIQSKDLIFQFVSDSFRMRMQLLEDKNRVTELATPLLLTANNEVSRLFVGQEYPIVRNISSQVVQNQTSTAVAPNTTIEFRPVGTTLLLTPNINADRTVTLRILQENSKIIKNGASIPVVTSNSNGSSGIISQPVDVVAARTLSGTIVAKDGLMLAVGGLVEESVNDDRSEVPILGKVPGLGFFFRQQSTGRSRTEMIIMIRPHVLNTPAESEAISKDLLKTLSIHPAATQPSGDLKTFKSDEVLQSDLPKDKVDSIFRFHSVKPADY